MCATTARITGQPTSMTQSVRNIANTIYAPAYVHNDTKKSYQCNAPNNMHHKIPFQRTQLRAHSLRRLAPCDYYQVLALRILTINTFCTKHTQAPNMPKAWLASAFPTA